jgi:hypothetical protein
VAAFIVAAALALVTVRRVPASEHIQPIGIAFFCSAIARNMV